MDYVDFLYFVFLGTLITYPIAKLLNDTHLLIVILLLC